jgi:chemotaxis protein methyltransferase CheR
VSITGEDFEYMRTFIRARAAIALDPGKEYLVETRLQPVALREGFADLAALVRRLRAGPPAALELAVVEALTTNETSFFRDWRPFEALRTSILPDLLARRASSRRLNVWSAACSGGQEIYSLAMLLREHFPQLATWEVALHATDLSTEMVERTRAGRFTQLEVNRGLPAPLLVKYFKRDADAWCVDPSLRALVRASQLNLAGLWPTLPMMDLVLLRNVLIYFDVPTKKLVLDHLRQKLAPGGVLFLGTAETTLGVTEGYVCAEAAGTTFFRVG